MDDNVNDAWEIDPRARQVEKERERVRVRE